MLVNPCGNDGANPVHMSESIDLLPEMGEAGYAGLRRGAITIVAVSCAPASLTRVAEAASPAGCTSEIAELHGRSVDDEVGCICALMPTVPESIVHVGEGALASDRLVARGAAALRTCSIISATAGGRW